jgi:DNA-binding beta-propeller fold protein YncE
MKKIIIFSLSIIVFITISCKEDDNFSIPESASYLFYTSYADSSIGRVDLKNSNNISTYCKGILSGIFEQNLVTIALNSATGDLYVSANGFTDDKIYKINVNGRATLFYSGTETGSMGDMTYNASNNKLYWVNNRDNKIYSLSSSGSGLPAALFGTQLINASGNTLEIDEKNGKIYYSGGLNIYTGNLDGSGTPQVLYTRIVDTLKLPGALKIDNVNNKIYWADEDEELIGSANLDGTGNFKILFRVPGGPYGLDIDFVSKKIYWTNINSGVKNIQIGNLDGTGTPATLVSNIESYGIILK